MEFSFAEWPEQEITEEDIRDAAFLDGYDTALQHIENIINNCEGNILGEIARFIYEYGDMQ